MKTQEKKELQTKTREELQKLVVDAEKGLVELLLDKEQNKLKNTTSISRKKDEIAVVKTILKIKEGEAK